MGTQKAEERIRGCVILTKNPKLGRRHLSIAPFVLIPQRIQEQTGLLLMLFPREMSLK